MQNNFTLITVNIYHGFSFNFYTVLWQQILGEVATLFQPFLHFIAECKYGRIIKNQGKVILKNNIE